MHQPFFRSATLLAMCLLPLASAAGTITNSFTVPGAIPDAMNAQQLNLVGVMVLQARNALLGQASPSSEPWPCVPGDMVAAFIQPNNLGAYTRIKSALLRQGWRLKKEVKALGFDQYSVMYSKGNLNMMGMWAAGSSGPRSTVFFCQLTARSQAASPATQDTAFAAPQLALPFSVPLQNWNSGPRSVIGLGTDAEGQGQLLTRGTINASGRLTLTLPSKPSADLLRPASEWAGVFGFSECEGTLNVSAPRVLVARIEEIHVLKTTMPATTSASQMLAAPVDSNHTIWSGAFETGVHSIQLVYTSAPVVVQGNLSCSDDDSTIRVSVRLPGGWSALVDTQSETGARTLLMPTGGAELRDWHDSAF